MVYLSVREFEDNWIVQDSLMPKDAGTAQNVRDNLNASRALQAYVLAVPIVNQAGVRDSLRKFGPDIAGSLAVEL